MAESSSAVASTYTAANSSYDVFINHRGPDVKKTFASHLYRRLLSYGLRVFLDQPELQRGDYFTTQIEDAIRSASVHVAIFSQGYADSIWCLDELVQMLDSKAPIIPVFYHVKPTELRRTRGKKRSYAEALEKLERKTEYDPQTHEEKLRYDSIRIENWRNVLSHVADISGFELEACNGDEGELVDKVVEGVLKKVKRPALDVARYPSGLDDKLNDFENTVLMQRKQSGKPQILGIMGLGGVGKTTLAKEFFNRKSSDCSRSCFLSDVRDNADKSSLNSLQRELIKSLTGSDNPINSVAEGIGMLRKHLSCANALVIIDDVDHEDQVYALLPDQTVLHSDSLILITSRSKDVLKRSGVEESSIYNLTGLSEQHSLELFCLHSFNQPHPLPEFESLVDKFLEACGGLPLSLKVFGALLNGEDTSYWKDQLDKLQRILPKEIKQRLQISYDALDMEEKQIFLDIACFFIGEDRDMAVRIWENGLCGFRNIQNKCLVEVNSENKIKMHDHLRDLGRDVAKAPGLPRRLWRWTENDIDDLLLQQSSAIPITVRGIRMVLSEHDDIDDGDALGGIRMRRLQLLNTEGVLVERILTKVQSPNLTWLRWNKCPCSSLSSSISMKNLRVLEVQGSELETLWENESQAPLHLQELRIDAPLSNIPKSIGQLKHLERIVIRFNYGSSSLVKLPEEFCLLQSLKALVLKGCPEMKSLPECLGNLTNLQQIQLEDCRVLERLPDSFCNLANLGQIQLEDCRVLESLPESFGNLTNLQQIQLSGCALKTLPDSFGKLIKLRNLNLQHCTNLTMSSETLGNISTLEYINLTGCRKIEVLPAQVAHQRSLQQLLLELTNLNELPSAIGELSDLEVLKVGSPLLDTLPPSLCGLKNLTELQLYGCEELKCLPPSLGDLRNLKNFIISGCEALKCLPFKKEVKGEQETSSDLDSSIDTCILPRLQVLRVVLSGISEVSFAEGVCFNLRHLCVKGCDDLVEIGTLPNKLIDLSIECCSNLRKIDKMSGLAKLQQLDICDSIELEELPSIETLVSLSRLWARGCVKLKSIKGLGQLTKLRDLWISRCFELEELEGIQHCMSLQSLNAKECPKLHWSVGTVEQLRQRCSISL